MAQCTDCDARIKYPGDGSQQNYTFPFEYTKTTEIHVSVYDEEQLKYVSLEHGTEWRLINATTVQLKEPSLTPIVIYRCTDLNHMEATFHPGHSVKAEDLNDDFNQLKFAIEETRCGLGSINEELLENKSIYLNRIKAGTDLNGLEGDLVKSNSDLIIDDDHVASTQWIDNRYWDQCDETTLSTDRWVDEIDDAHVPTTKAVEQRIVDLDVEGARGFEKVTGEMQRNKQWDEFNTDDNHFATTDALVERHDTYVNESNEDFKENRYTQPGKFWVKDDENILFYRRDSGSAWIQVNTKGERGDEGQGATVDVGTTTTGLPGTDADVTNSGTNVNAIFDFVIPRGDKGEAGTDGNLCTLGDNPPSDPVEGDTWFRTSCPSGLYVWSGTEWIGTSIPGSPGSDGVDGADGNLCTLGDNPPSDPVGGDTWFKTSCPTGLYVWSGTQWIGTSIPGPPGAEGSDGIDGIDGAPGADGSDGADGADGKSAYELYLESTTDTPPLTESEWLASLEGEDGEDGDDGNLCLVGDSPPPTPKIGDSWFNTNCPVGLHVWDGDFWINTTVPGPPGANGVRYTFKAPLVETNDEVSFSWSSLTDLI